MFSTRRPHFPSISLPHSPFSTLLEPCLNSLPGEAHTQHRRTRIIQPQHRPFLQMKNARASNWRFHAKVQDQQEGKGSDPPNAMSSIRACLDCNRAEVVLPPSGQAQLPALSYENGAQRPSPLHPPSAPEGREVFNFQNSNSWLHPEPAGPGCSSQGPVFLSVGFITP